MKHKDSRPSGRDEGVSSISGRERDLDELDRRSHGGTQNGSTESARERGLSDAGDGGGHSQRSSGSTDE